MTMRKRALVVAALSFVVGGMAPRNAAAVDRPVFQNYGPMKNLIIDLIFWGPFQQNEMQDVRDYVKTLSAYLMGVSVPANTFSPTGFEAAVHYYGVQGIYPEAWQIDNAPIYPQDVTDTAIEDIVANARAGTTGVFSPAFDFSNNVIGQTLPAGPNHLTMVITKGTGSYLDWAPKVWYETVDGLHNTSQTYGFVYGGARFDNGDWTGTLSHEILEALTDPDPWNGWAADIYLVIPNEGADECGDGSFQQSWFASTGDNISGVSTFALNPQFGFDSIPPSTCALIQPEQHTPLAAALEYGGNGEQPLVLYYRTPNGHIAQVAWSNYGQPAHSPIDYGQPSPTVTAVGKPTMIFGLYAGGEYLFVKGSDGALWMLHNNQWTSLGGWFHGDPSAVLWNNGQLIDVFVTGSDDRIYFFGLTGSSQFGWAPMPDSNNTAFVGSPTVISRDGHTLDVFATGEDGDAKWMTMNSSGAWSAPTTMVDFGTNEPIISTMSATSAATNQLSAFGVGQFGLWNYNWNGSSWSAEDAPFQLPSPYTPYYLEGTAAAVMSSPSQLDLFAVDRYSALWHWFRTPQGWSVGAGTPTYPIPLVASNVSGDPLAISRYAGEVEVFYRTGSGALGHISMLNSTSTTEIVPGTSVE